MTHLDLSRPKRSGLMRLARIVLFVVAIYLVGANVLLNTALLAPLVNRKPERFTLHWDRGLMLWPGRITLWDVTMHGQVRHNAWKIQAQRVSGRVALWPLLRKELRFAWIDGEHPQIALRPVAHDLPPLPSGQGLRLVFEDVRVASPLRFSLDDTQLDAEVEARASWSQQLRGGTFQLQPSTLRLQHGRVARGEKLLVSDLFLEGKAEIDAHRRGEHRGIGILDFLRADVTLSGSAPGFALDVDEAFNVGHSLHGSRGEVAGRIVLAQGALGAQTDLSVRIPIHARTHSGHQADGDARLRLSPVGEDIALQLSLPPIPDLIERAQADLSLDSLQLPLPPWDAQLQRLNGEIDLHARFSSLALARPLLARLKGLELDGRGDVEGRVVLVAGELAAGTQVNVKEAEFELLAYSHRFHGAAKADARIAPHADGAVGAVAKVTLERFDIAPANAPGEVLGSGRNLVLDLSASGTLAQLRDRLDARLRFSDARLPELSRFNRYLPKNGVRFLSGSGRIGADMRMHVADDRNGGTLSLAASAAALRVGEMVLRGDLALDARLDAGRLDNSDFALPGTRIAIRRAAIVEPLDERVQNWWGTVDITRGKVSFGQPMVVSADADVAMRDIAPLLSLFAQNKRFPRWIRSMIDAGQAKVSGRLRMRDDSVIVDHIIASNERFDVKARLRLDDDKPSGHLYARWGVLGLGLELVRGEREFHLAGAKKWFEAQTPYLPER